MKPPRGSFAAAGALAALALAPLVAISQPAGPEFPVNATTTNLQLEPQVASDPAGGFVVVWSSEQQDGSGWGIFGRRYASTGAPLAGEFRVNSFTTLYQYEPSVAVQADGGFVVVWSGDFGGPFSTIVGRRFSSTGAPLTSDFRVNASTTSSGYAPRVAADPAGGFVVVWMGYVAPGSFDVFGRRFAGSGAPLGAEFRVNVYTPDFQGSPALAVDAAGGFVVAWESYGSEGGGYDVYARRFSSAGSPLGSEFRVNTATTFYQRSAAVAFDTAGRFGVVWHSYPESFDIRGQRYSNDGTPLGTEFAVNAATTDRQFHPAIASDGGGGFLVSWGTQPSDGSSQNVLARAFRGSGAPAGPEFRVNAATTGYATSPSIASDAKGSFVIAWESWGGAPSYTDVFGRRFLPAMLKGDVNADGTRDVLDVFYLINHLFAGGPELMGWGDLNADGKVDVLDVFYLINHLFAGGPAPI